MGKETVERVAGVMRAKRRELINQPLDRIWDELATAAVEAVILEPVGWQFKLRNDEWVMCDEPGPRGMEAYPGRLRALYALLEK